MALPTSTGGVFDALAMMQQLGAIPQSPPDRSIGLATRRGRGSND